MNKSEKLPESAISAIIPKEPDAEGKIWLRYMDWVMGLKGRSHAFRGQADASWPVQASAYRRLVNKGMEHPELAKYLFTGYLHERVNEVKMRFNDHNRRHPLEVMAWMQHHGFATGLIDFTDSALVALWFACKDKQNTSGKIIAVRLDDNDKIKEIKNREDIKKNLEAYFPIESTGPNEKLHVWHPGDGDPRMITQQSLFIFGVPEIVDKDFIVDDFLVQAEEKDVYMEFLKRMGVSEVSIFPDFTGFSIANSSDKDYDLHLAEIYYAEKINRKPRHALNYFQKGIFNAAREAYKEAIKDFRKVIEIDPQSEAAHYNLGNALRNLGRNEEAVSAYNRAIEIDPRYEMAYNNRGGVLCLLRRYKEAISDQNKIIEINPRDAAAYNNRGVALHALRHREEAILDWKAAKRIGEKTGDTQTVQDATDNLTRYGGLE